MALKNKEFKPRMMDWYAARVFAEKNLRIAFRYPANLFIWGFFPVLWLAPYLLTMMAISGASTSSHFMELSGFNDFITFAIIGWFVFQYVDASIWSLGNNLRWEQFAGTLEPLFMTPVPRISILLGAALSDTVQASISAVVFLGLSIAMFGVTYSIAMIGPILLFLVTMIVALYGFGFMVAGLILVFKDPSVLSQFVDSMIFMGSPINYPLKMLPQSARYLSYLLPSTLAIIVVRQLAICGTLDIILFVTYYAGLLVILVLFWVIGIGCFRLAEHWTKTRGHMGGF